MYTLVFILATPAFLGEYMGLASCQNAIREIYSIQANPPGRRLPELEESINLRVSMQKSYVCIPKSKG
jgi:hypothetical protein